MAQRPLRVIPNSWVIGVTISLAILTALGLLGPVQRFAVRVLAPIGRVSHRAVEGIRVTFADRKHSQDVATENTTLKERLLQVELERAKLNQQLAELKILRAEQSFLDRRTRALSR